MQPFVITMSWPHADLSPNARKHWAAVAKRKKAQKHEAISLCMAAGPGKAAGAGQVPVSIEFCPPDNRARDLDNLQASMKAALDGISFYIGANDSRFTPVSRWGEVVRGGRVIVRVG